MWLVEGSLDFELLQAVPCPRVQEFLKLQESLKGSRVGRLQTYLMATLAKDEIALRQSLRVDGQSQRARRETWPKLR